MDDYLDRFEQESERRRACDLLTTLAYAEGSGLPPYLWSQVAGVLAAKDYDEDDIDRVLHTPVADLVDEANDSGSVTGRLFHQALSDYLRGSPERQGERQRALTRALEASVPELPDATGRDWARASSYVRTHLATHAAAGGVLDPLVEDPGFLVAADCERLLLALPSLTAPAACLARPVYRSAFDALRTRPPAERASYLELSARQAGADDLVEQFARQEPTRPWSAQWARWRPAGEHFIAGRHDGWVSAVAVGELDGRPVAVSGGSDATLRVWDLGGSELAAIEVGSAIRAVQMRSPTILIGADAGVIALSSSCWRSHPRRCSPGRQAPG